MGDRIAGFRAIWSRAWFRWCAYIWTPVAAWDTIGSQFLPPSLAQSAPTAYQVVAMTYGWLPWWLWVLIAVSIFCVASFEYAVRSQRKFVSAEKQDIDPRRRAISDFLNGTTQRLSDAALNGAMAAITSRSEPRAGDVNIQGGAGHSGGDGGSVNLRAGDGGPGGTGGPLIIKGGDARAEDVPAVECDTPLLEAVCYLIRDRRWLGPGEMIGVMGQRALAPWGNAIQEIRSKAGKGLLHVEGKRHRLNLPEPIRKEFWIDHQIDLLSIMAGNWEEVKTERTTGDQTRYEALQVNKIQVEQLWPPI
jgi:hypothetical protein